MKINFFRPGVALAAVAATAAGFAGTTLTTHATDVHAVQCPASPAAAVTANGSSLQNRGVQAAITAYQTACGITPTPAVTYTATGSGTCIGEANANSTAVQFCGTDVPYSNTDWATMNSTGWGGVQTFPIALSAVDYVTSTSFCGGSQQISGAQLGQVFSGAVTDWHAIFSSCAAGSTIDLGVRSNACSGTTAAAKDYLAKKDPTDFATIKAQHACDTFWAAGHVTCTGSTNSALANCTSDANLITYVDESDTASHSPTLARHPIDNAAGTFSNFTAGACASAASSGATPNSTAANWSTVSVTDQPLGYGDCTFTYQLARTAGSVNGGAGMTAAQGANVRGFIQYELSDAGQAQFVANSYDALPTNLQVHGQAGAAGL